MHRHLAVFLCGVFVLASARAETRLPGPEWQSRAPAEAGPQEPSRNTG